MTARAKEHRTREGPGLRRASAREVTPADDDAERELVVLLKLVDELARLAADLWFAGKLDHFSAREEAADGDEE